MFLLRRVSLAVGAAVGAILCLAAAAGVIRLLPWLLAEDVPVAVAEPFARALLAAGAEASLLIGLPVGVALGIRFADELGEIRALAALGVSPTRLALKTLPALLVAVAGFVVLNGVLDAAAHRPGRFAGQLLEQGRASCQTRDRAGAAVVPLVNMSWLCFPDRAPRVAGPLPRSGGRIWFTARQIRINDDLTHVELDGLQVVSRGRRATVRAERGTIRGLPPWGQTARLDAGSRAAAVAAAALAAAFLLAYLALRRRERYRTVGVQRVGAILWGAMPGIFALAALRWVERSEFTAFAGTVVVLAAVTAVMVSWLMGQALFQLVARLRRG